MNGTELQPHNIAERFKGFIWASNMEEGVTYRCYHTGLLLRKKDGLSQVRRAGGEWETVGTPPPARTMVMRCEDEQ